MYENSPSGSSVVLIASKCVLPVDFVKIFLLLLLLLCFTKNKFKQTGNGDDDDDAIKCSNVTFILTKRVSDRVDSVEARSAESP